MLLSQIKLVANQALLDNNNRDDINELKHQAKVTLAWLFVIEAILVLQSFPIKLFTDELLRPSVSLTRLALVALTFIATYSAGTYLRYVMRKSRNRFYMGFWKVSNSYGGKKLLLQSTDWHTANGTGEKDSLVSRNIIKFQGLIDEIIFTTIPVSFRIVVTTILLFIFAWPLGIVASLMLAAYAYSLIYSEKKLLPLREQYQAEIKVCEASSSEMNRNWRTIKSLGVETNFIDTNDNLLDALRHRERPRYNKAIYFLLSQEHIVNFCRGLLYLIAGWLFTQGELDLGSIVLCTSWFERMLSNIERFGDFQIQLNVGQAALRELTEFLSLEPSVAEPKNPLWPQNPQGRVELSDVTFAYPGSADKAICGLDLTIQPGTCQAFVGYSGCGKSTLIRLLMRDYDLFRGNIRIDDIDIKEFDGQRYRNQLLAVVNQEVQMFDTDVIGNIRLGRPSASDDEVVTAAIQAGAHDFIMTFRDGYQTMIGENGIKLSGGQKQRLAIARALLMKPKILILDEATSSLDAKSQADIQESIDNLIRQRICTVIIIAHRLSTIRGADNIAVIKNGRLVDNGSHSELLTRCELYQELVMIETAG